MAFVKRFVTASKERFDSGVEVVSELLSPVPTLYIGNSPSNIDEKDRAMIQEFQDCGFKVEYLTHKTRRKQARYKDLGIGASPFSFDIEKREELYQMIPSLEQPKRFSFDEVSQNSGPIVAKDISVDRGESVFLLEDKEALCRFLVWQHTFAFREVAQNYMDGTLVQRANRIIEASRMVRNKRWNWEGFKDMKPEKGWIFQEFIETPGDYYTSFRILADGYGNIHYGTLLRSPETKGKRKIKDPRPVPPENPAFELLYRPGSNFQLPKTPNIVSNAIQGGISIQLNGERITDETNRSVATAHNIDPDNPQIPESIAEKASLLGRYMKLAFPYIGVDFIYNQECKDLFLEGNAWPALFAEGLGVSQQDINNNVINPNDRSEVQTYLSKILIKRVVRKTFPNLKI